jgi:hypothetical protein
MKLEVEFYNNAYYLTIDEKSVTPQEASDILLAPIKRKYDNSGLFAASTVFFVDGRKTITSDFSHNFYDAVQRSESEDPIIEIEFRIAKIKELALTATKTKKIWTKELT